MKYAFEDPTTPSLADMQTWVAKDMDRSKGRQRAYASVDGLSMDFDHSLHTRNSRLCTTFLQLAGNVPPDELVLLD
jgi:hypothetical protein